MLVVDSDVLTEEQKQLAQRIGEVNNEEAKYEDRLDGVMIAL